MNAGAYGHAMQEVLQTVSVMDSRGRTETFPASGMAFRYRSLDLAAGHLIVEATLVLQAGDGEGIREEVSEILALRRRKHPLAYRNAGSIFRNPPEGPAGRIIEEAGLKGLQVGDAQVSAHHANFIVNRGRATARDITTLMETIRDRVWETTCIRLEPEVVVIGEER